ncbi:clathrin interactor EPSIN 1-like [Arachis duranensis]|uniref:Clathrin interactor EPSIN 1 n=1 Tax=Arachis duranensis TaxID=130453 RepID=A0A6P4C9K7_ARADU|nr:clathrin interactor EPSIN 1 [Arachis duranensis]XP_052116223.1 clathrin interactor EPSIN 1-like [Arachis duranensis]
MDFMKVFDQTVREIKREVNLKVLKVPEIEQKVLDATDNEPWGPHGSALAEIALATKKFTECQMVMNVLWTRLTETGKDWRYVYKALAVIEYLVAHGSERAVDDIIEHTFQISALSSFEYVEPSGKDSGLNVRKKAETIVALLNNREKIQEVRNKAAANRDKYVGVSSSGITYKSGSTSFSSGSYQSSGKYSGFGSNDGDRFKDSYRDKGDYEEDKYIRRSRNISDDEENSFKKGTAHSVSKSQENAPSRVSKSSTANAHDNYSSVASQSSSAPANNTEDDFDDFDPRGTSAKPSAGSSNQVDLFGQDLISDFMDAPTSVSTEKAAANSVSEVDLFADASFVSAPPNVDKGASSQPQEEVDLFASQPAIPSVTPTVDLFSIPKPVAQPDKKSGNSSSANSITFDPFAVSEPVVHTDTGNSAPVNNSTFDPFAIPEPVAQPNNKSRNSAPANNSTFDPFAAIPLNNFDGSDVFGDFTSQPDSASSQTSNNVASDINHDKMNGKTSVDSKVSPKKDPFQVKSGIWADSLSRGLIDLNISGPKKVNLADVGIVGGLSDGSDEVVKGPPPPSFYMGRAMGSGSGLGRSGFTPSQTETGNDMFSSLSSQQYQFGGFQK